VFFIFHFFNMKIFANFFFFFAKLFEFTLLNQKRLQKTLNFFVEKGDISSPISSFSKKFFCQK